MKMWIGSLISYLSGAFIMYLIQKNPGDEGYRFWVITFGIFGVSLFLPLVFKDLKRKNGDVSSKDKLGSRVIIDKK